MSKMFCVDIPDPLNPDGEWISLGDFSTKEEALAFVSRLFDADDEGRISLISEIDLGEDEEETEEYLE